MPDSGEILVRNIKRRLTKMGIRAADLARRTHFSTAKISNYLNGQHVPSLENIDKIAEALETTTFELLTPEDHEYKPTPKEALEILREFIEKKK